MTGLLYDGFIHKVNRVANKLMTQSLFDVSYIQ